MPIINDAEFGAVTFRRSSKATSLRVRVGPNGLLRGSMPLYAPVFLAKRLLEKSRPELRAMVREHSRAVVFEDGMIIGKSHTLIVNPQPRSHMNVKRQGQRIVVTLTAGGAIGSASTQRAIRDVVIEAIRLEAKSYLPKRLAFLARQHGFSYASLRFSHASGRWGSCSSNDTISLNIALMRLPFELIDYVLIHELSHTVEMNHSTEFWAIVSKGDPHYKAHRAQLKSETPSI